MNQKEKNVVCIDESGIKNSMKISHGWAERGKKICGRKKGHATEKLNIIAGMTENRIVSPLAYNYNTDSKFFSIWIEQHLIPEPEEKSAVVLDNARFHRTKKTKEIVEKYGHELLCLPPCSPDLNPIEKFWAVPEAKIRKIIGNYSSLWDCVGEVFKTI